MIITFKEPPPDHPAEGIGSTYYKVISLISIAKYLNIDYIHSKYRIGHNYNNINEDEWNKLYYDFFNLQKITKSFDNYDLTDYKIITNHELTLEHFNYINNSDKNKKEIFYFVEPFNITLNDPNKFYPLIRNDIIDAYNEVNYNRPLIYNKNKKNIAIHIRVYNSNDDSYYYEGYLNYSCDRFKYNENMYISIINKIINKYPDYDIHIYSQNDFKERYPNIYANSKFNIHLDTDILDLLHHMIKADVLLLGFSCLSHLAGIYNTNTVIYLNYHMPLILNNWIDINSF